MSKETFLVAFDGKDRGVVDAAADWAKKQNAQLFIVHVLEWQAYSFLTPAELAARHKHRQEELDSANSAMLGPVLDYAAAKGVSSEGEVRHGNVVDTICAVASEENASLIFCGRSDKFSGRVFGSVAFGLVQSAIIPVVIVP